MINACAILDINLSYSMACKVCTFAWSIIEVDCDRVVHSSTNPELIADETKQTHAWQYLLNGWHMQVGW